MVKRSRHFLAHYMLNLLVSFSLLANSFLPVLGNRPATPEGESSPVTLDDPTRPPAVLLSSAEALVVEDETVPPAEAVESPVQEPDAVTVLETPALVPTPPRNFDQLLVVDEPLDNFSLTSPKSDPVDENWAVPSLDEKDAQTQARALEAFKPAVVVTSVITYGQAVDGSIFPADEIDSFTFVGQANQHITAFLVNWDGGCCTYTDLSLELFDPGGTSLAFCDFTTGHCQFDDLVLPQSGTYTLTVDGEGGDTGDYTLRILSMAANPELIHFTGHIEDVTSVTFSPSGAQLLSGSNDDTARLWDVADGAFVHTFIGHTNDVNSVAFSFDGSWALTGSDDNIARLWNVANGQSPLTYSGHGGDVLSTVFSPDGTRALTGGTDNTAHLWDTTNGANMRIFSGHTADVNTVAYSPNGTQVLTGSDDDTARLWDANSGALIRTLSHSGDVTSVAFSSNGVYLLTGSTDDIVRLWNASTGQLLFNFTHTADITSVAFSPLGNLIAVASGNFAYLWDPATGHQVIAYQHTANLTSITFAPDGTSVAIGSVDDTALVWILDPELIPVREAEALTLGVVLERQVSSLGWKDYSLTTSDGLPLLVEVTPLSGIQGIGVYGRFGQLPTLALHDFRALNPTARGTYELLISPTQNGSYYFSVFGWNVVSGGGTFQILARTTSHHLSDITPRIGGNVGGVTVSLTGLGWVEEVQVELLGPDTVIADSVTLASPTKIWTHFDLDGKATGIYDVHVTWPDGEEATLSNAFTVIQGVGSILETTIDSPDTIRLNRTYVLWIEYANTGDADMEVPLFIISSPQNSVTFSLDASTGPSKEAVQILGVNFAGPVEIIPPGATYQIPVYFKVTQMGLVHFYLTQMVADETPIDWNLVEAQIKPPGVNPTTWDAMFVQLQQQIGTTWADYLETLTINAQRRAKWGQIEYDISILFHDEIKFAYTNGDGAISGTVYSVENGAVIENVEVIATPLDSGGYLISDFTNEDGQFALPNLVTGSYDLQVNGYLSTDPVQMNAVNGEDISGVELWVELGGLVSGSVVIQGGGVVTETVIVATNEEGGTFTASVDEDGNYAIVGLPTGIYQIQTDLLGYATQLQDNIEVNQGESIESIDFVLEPGGSLSGIVTSISDGMPIENAQVLAQSISGILLGSETDENGEYEIDQFASGDWLLTISADGWLTTDPITITIVAPGSVVQDVSLSIGSTFTGLVTDINGQPISNTAVIATSETGTGIAQTDSIGNYAIKSLPAEVYTIEANANGFVSQTIISQTIGSGQTVNNVDFSLDNGKTFSGLITAADSSLPVEGAKIYLQGNSGVQYFISSSADGTFSFNTLLPDIYILEVTEPGYIPYLQMVDLTQETPPSPADVTLDVGGSIIGSVTLQDGITPITNTLVTILVNGTPIEYALTDENGQYVINGLTSNTYSIAVFDDTYAIPAQEEMLNAPNTISVNFSAGASIFQGIVTDDLTGLPVNNTKISIILQGVEDWEPSIYTAVTNTDGEYLFDHLVAGSYWVVVSGDGYAQYEFMQTIDPPPTITVSNISLIQPYIIMGTVIDASNNSPITNTAIILQQSDSSVSNTYQYAVSDINGEYEFLSVLPNSTINLYAQGEGFVWQVQSNILVSSSPLIIDWSLLNSGATVYGHLTEAESNLPVGGQTVILSGSNLSLETLTNDEGYFVFNVVPIGSWDLTVEGEVNGAAKQIIIESLSDIIEEDLIFHLTYWTANTKNINEAFQSKNPRFPHTERVAEFKIEGVPKGSQGVFFAGP